jgi:hypothetical protein
LPFDLQAGLDVGSSVCIIEGRIGDSVGSIVVGAGDGDWVGVQMSSGPRPSKQALICLI